MQTAWEFPKIPREGPGPIVESSGERYFSIIFIISARNVFHTFEIQLDEISTLWVPGSLPMSPL